MSCENALDYGKNLMMVQCVFRKSFLDSPGTFLGLESSVMFSIFTSHINVLLDIKVIKWPVNEGKLTGLWAAVRYTIGCYFKINFAFEAERLSGLWKNVPLVSDKYCLLTLYTYIEILVAD